MDTCHCVVVVVSSESRSVVSNSLGPHGLNRPWNSPGQNTGVGSLSLLQGILPTQGLNPGLPPCRRILYQLSHIGSPRILGWVVYPFSRESSRPRNQTRVSCTAGGFFTSWAMREAKWYSVAKWCSTLCDPMDWLLCSWDFPGKNTGVRCHLLLQGIFLDQRWNSCLLHWQAGFLPLSHQGSPTYLYTFIQTHRSYNNSEP